MTEIGFAVLGHGFMGAAHSRAILRAAETGVRQPVEYRRAPRVRAA